MVGIGARRRWAWLVGVLAVALLPFAPVAPLTSPAHADPPVFDGKEIKDLCTISAGGQDCPVFPPPPPLLNPGAVTAAGTVIGASLERLQDQAVENTLADHGLPASDRDAVLSWGRDDAEAELWALVVEALTTSEAERTPDQQHAAQWMAQLASAQSVQSAKQAGAEYATWAGLDVNAYNRMAGTGTTAQLTNFLSADVRPFSPLFTPRGGYCRYTPPDPYSDDYDGSTTPTCFTSCPSVTGCPIPTPTKDDFVSWGQAVVSNGTLSDTTLQTQAAKIAKASMYATVGTAAALVVGSALTAVLTSSAALTVIFTTVTTAGEVVGGAAIGTLAGAAAIAGAVLIVLLAIVTAVLEGIRVSDNAALPGKIAEYVVNARTTVTDPASLITTTDGATSLFNMFVGATLPRPRYDVACDNSLIPPWAYTSSFDPNLLIYVPLGENKAITSPANRDGCLNPPPIPPAAPTDAHFLVRVGGVGTPQVRQSLDIGGDPAGTTQKVRLSGNWFVDSISQGGNTRTWQQLTLDFYDWDGVGNVAWLVREADGTQKFVGAVSPDDVGSLDPDTCEADGSCWESDQIKYVDADGRHYSATIEQPAGATGQPTYSPREPLEASPVTFDAGTFEPPSSDHQVDYSWRFQELGCGLIQCVSGPTTPDYNGPFTGKTVTYTWDSIGPAKVELTATDQHGHSATTVFTVQVGNVPPTALALHENTATVGQAVTLQGVAKDVGADDDLNIVVNYGDGHSASTKVGPNSLPLLDPSLTRLRISSQSEWSILATHTYTQPGIYYGSYTVSDWGGGSDSDTFVVRVTGQQQLAFPAVADATYGGHLTPATGSPLSGVPVTYDAGPDDVCRPSDAGQAVDLVGVGSCTVTAHQVANPPMYLAAAPVQRTFDVTPAPLTIKAVFADKVYGADNPTFTASYTGLVNGDTKEDLPGLVFDAPPASSGVGDYTITPSGAANPNYAITYAIGTFRIKRAQLAVLGLDYTRHYGEENPTFSWVINGLVNGDTAADIPGVTMGPGPAVDAAPGLYQVAVSVAPNANPNYDTGSLDGTLTIKPAPLTITADDATSVYGGPAPELTASYDGFVLDDDESDVTGLQLTRGAADGADVGDYDITPSGASLPNYDVSYVKGTEHVTPAKLTVTADDQTRKYGGARPTYTASFDGLVNGDTKADVPGIAYDGAPADADVGGYDITPSGASNDNYDITYADGTEHVTPADLTITADDQTRKYGGAQPTYSASFDGLVNGDTRADVPGISYDGAPADADVGSYDITPSGATNPNYDITYARGTEHVTPAPLTITADDQTRTYGAGHAPYTASFDGLVNGDTEADVPGISFDGAPTDAGVGSYDITPSGATNDNYDISYAAGTEHVTRAPLTITADDQTRTYGGARPTYTARFDGLVNGDTKADLAGLSFTGPPATAHVGGYPITPSGAASPNYAVTFARGTEHVTPAPLTIRPRDVVVASGGTPAYTWFGVGWVNGDSEPALMTAPICGATVPTTPGEYAGAVRCAGARAADYDISYGTAALRVDPLISLAQRGLPKKLPARATLDGASITLPVVRRVVTLGSHHTISFPAVLLDQGKTYVTTAAAFEGPVTANLDVTATYLPMKKVLKESTGMAKPEAVRLARRWDRVEDQIAPRHRAKLLAALHAFAQQVRRETGAGISPDTARVLLTYARAVYQRFGGSGTV